MKTNFIKLSAQAADLIANKSKIPSSKYMEKMEALVYKLAEEHDISKLESPSTDLDLVEKMSFEIRTPMNTILGFTSLLKDSYFTQKEKNEFIKLIEKNTQHLVQVLNDLTDLTKIENFQTNLRIEEFEINIFILNLMASFQEVAKEKGITLDKLPSKISLENICVSADPYQLQHILENMLLSVINFSENNKMHLSVNIEESSFLLFTVISENDKLPDTMINNIKNYISYSGKEKSFDKTGLRLTLTKALVDLMGGKIEFNCIQEKGSEFILRIPINKCSKG